MSAWRFIALQKFNISKTTFLILLIAVFILPESSNAHPMGRYAICHFAAIRPHRDEIRIRYIIDIAEYHTFYVLKNENLQHKRNRRYSEDEIERLRSKHVPQLVDGLELYVDNSRLELEVVNSFLEIRDGLPGLKITWIQIDLKAPIQYRAWETRTVTYRDNNYPDVVGWKELKVFGTENTRIVTISSLSDKTSNGLTDYPRALMFDPPVDTEVEFVYGPGKGESFFGQVDEAITEPELKGFSRIRRKSDEIIQALLLRFDFFKFLEEERLGFGVIMISVAFAFIGGMLHSLQPGHGKTLVAAYLVGSKGRPKHAVILGAIVTVTHVAAVIVLFLVLMAFWKSLNPDIVYPWLGVGSGIIIIAMGLWIFVRNLTGKYLVEENGDTEECERAENFSKNSDPAGDEVKTADLIALGITGGIIPCPTAFMLLFASVGLGRLPFGLLLTTAFSIGMATALISIGLLVVKTKNLVRKNKARSRGIKFMPYVSGVFIVIIGIGIMVKGLRMAGIL